MILPRVSLMLLATLEPRSQLFLKSLSSDRKIEEGFHAGQNTALSFPPVDGLAWQQYLSGCPPSLSLSLFSFMHVQGRPLGKNGVSYQIRQPELVLEWSLSSDQVQLKPAAVPTEHTAEINATCLCVCVFAFLFQRFQVTLVRTAVVVVCVQSQWPSDCHTF